MHDGARYGMRTRLDVTFDEAITRVRSELEKAGFGVLTEIDVESTLKQKLNVDFRRYVILGACNPPLAHKALSTEIEIGLLLPCNIIVFEEGTGCSVSIADPRAMIALTGNPNLEEVATEAHDKLLGVLEALDQ